MIALREEDRALKSELAGGRLELDDARRRLAVVGRRLGLREVVTLVTPEFDGSSGGAIVD